MGTEWLQAGAVGVVAALFVTTLAFILQAMKTLNHISDRCHAHSSAIVSAMQDALKASTAAVVENTKQLGATEKTVDQLQKFLTKHNGD